MGRRTEGSMRGGDLSGARSSGARLVDLAWRDVGSSSRKQWTALVEGGGNNPSLRPDWLECAAEAWGVLEQVRVCLFTRNDALVAVVPFLLRRRQMGGLPVRTLELVGNLVSYHQEVLALNAGAEYLDAFLRHAGRYVWDALVVDNVVVGGRTDRDLRALTSPAVGVRLMHPGELSPFLSLPLEWEPFVVARKNSFRYGLRRAERHLDDHDGDEMRWYRGLDDWRTLLEQMVAIEDRSRKAQEGMNISARPEELRYYELLLPVLAQAGILFANVLVREGRPIAYSLCYAAGGQVGQMKTSFDEAFAKERPGFVSIAASVRRAVEEGFAEYDFLGDRMRHKSDWTSSVRKHVTHIVFRRSPRGLLLGATKRFMRAIRGVRSQASPESGEI